MTEEKKEKFEGHGNNWSATMGGDDFDVKQVVKTIVDAPNSVVKKVTDYSGIIGFDGPIKGLALIKINPENAELWSAYPFLQISNPIEVEIEKIEEYSNKVEAIISGSVGSVSVSFFDSLYFFNKDKYKIGEKFVFHLGAIALNFEKREEKDLILEPKEGPMKGEKLYTHKMTAFLPRADYGGEFEFTCPFVNFSGEVTAYDQKFKIFPYWVRAHDTDAPAFTLPMYINNKIIKGDCKTNDSVTGVAWLQGYLVDSFDDEIK